MKATALRDMLTRAGIVTTSVVVLGKFLHIDTSACHNDRLQHMLTAGGFTVLRAAAGTHLDGSTGFKISAKVRG